MTTRPLRKYRIDRNSACICGSGIKYKKCCLPTIGTDLKDKGSTYYGEGKFEEALSAYRAFLTQYIIWYNEHTVPFVSDLPESESAEFILKIDIDAMVSVVELISKCAGRLNKEEAIDDFLKYSFTLMRDWRYQFYISVLRAWWFHLLYNKQLALNICDSLEPINAESIPDTDICNSFLRLFYDITCLNKSFIQNLELLNIILTSPEDLIREIQDLTRKATLLWLYADEKQAIEILKEALNKIATSPLDDSKDKINYLLTLARCQEMLGYLDNDDESIKKALNTYSEILQIGTDEHFMALVLHSAGQMHLALGEIEKSLDALNKAYEMGGHKSLHVILDLAHILTIGGDIDKAKNMLSSIAFDKIDDNFKIDYLKIKAQIGIAENDLSTVSNIQSEMENLEINVPLFKEMRDKGIISLLELVHSKRDPKKQIGSWRKLIAKYFILQPNIYGIGFNFNKVLENKIDESKDRKE